MMPTPDDVRSECYGKILQSVRERADAYYRQNPELLDERAQKGLVELSYMLSDILTVLDDYTISRPRA